MHILEAGHESPGRPCVILLHGFPELAFSWRKVMVPLAEAGYYVVAPDQRGFGRTTGWDTTYDDDLAPFRVLNLVRDVVALVSALGYRTVAGVFGHDAGARVAAYCALIRPDLFGSVAIMSSPFPGPPALPFGTIVGGERRNAAETKSDIHECLAALARPRKHYQRYYTTRPANDDMWKCPQGVGAFMRAYYHYKSADWEGNLPYRLAAWQAEELAKMPTYYIMDRDCDMAETVAPFMPSESEIASCRWLTNPELAVYEEEYGRTGFQGGPSMVSVQQRPGTGARDAGLFGCVDRRTLLLHRRDIRLGVIPKARGTRGDADQRLSSNVGLPLHSRCGSLGAAGKPRGGSSPPS